MTFQSAELSIEKRKHPRVDVTVPAKFKIIGRGAERDRIMAEARELGNTTNVSSGGVALKTGVVLKKGDLIRLELELPGHETGIRTFAEVVWLKNGPDGKQSEAGLQFLAVKNEDEDLLSHFVLNVLKGQSL